MSFTHCRTTRGFSLVEMLVYLAILTALSSIVVGTLLSFSGTFESIRLSRTVSTSAISSLERMVRDVRDADRINTSESVFGSHPGDLTLIRDLSGGGTSETRFYLKDGALMVSVDGVESGALTTGRVTVESFIVSSTSSATSTGARVEMTLTASSGPISVSRAFSVFGVLRGSYE